MPQLNNTIYQNDMTFGFSEEDRLKPLLEKKFGELTKLDKYSSYDFENENYLIEMKSRRINHDKYNTLMINYSKIEKIDSMVGSGELDEDKNIVFIFNCEDGIYYWDLNKDEYTLGKGGRCDRGCNEFYKMAFINIEFIHPLDNLTDLN